MVFLEGLNVPSIIILVILCLIVVGVIVYLLKNRKKGCCGCSSESCAFRNTNKGCKDKTK